MRLRVNLLDDEGEILGTAEVSGATFCECMENAAAEFTRQGLGTGVLQSEQLPDA